MSKCVPNCSCKRHSRDPESVARGLATKRARGIGPPKCSGQPDCKCGRHWERTPEYRERQAELMRGRDIVWSDKIADTVRGTYRGGSATGRSVDKAGYVTLTGSTHPLAHRGSVREHRVILYDEIGPGLHPCHWCKKPVSWDGDRIHGLHVDHLNNDRLDNRPENLVPSCLQCNWTRQNAAHMKHRGEL